MLIINLLPQGIEIVVAYPIVIVGLSCHRFVIKEYAQENILTYGISLKL
jgi:hypothetical protein